MYTAQPVKWKLMPAKQIRRELVSPRSTFAATVVRMLIFCASLGSGYALFAQEAVRMSLASAEAAEARARAKNTLGYHNLRLGPTMWSFASSLGVEYNDNIRANVDELARSDILLRPQVDARMLWPVSQQNSLSLSLGAGYVFYMEHSEFNRLFLTPGTEISLDLYVGNVWINLHDRITITENTYQDPTVVGDASYSRLENAIGFTALWDLNKIVLRLGYDHLNYINLRSGESVYPDGESDNVYLSAGYVIQPEMTTGVEVGAGLVHYDLDESISLYQDATQWSVGGFYDARLTEYIHGRASVGYTVFTPDTDAEGVDEFNGTYARVSLSHRLNQYVDYTLVGGRQVSFAFYGGTIDIYTARLAANWRVLKDITLQTSFLFEHGSYVYAFKERFDRYGPRIAVGRRLTEKLSGTIAYQFWLRESNLAHRNYTINSIALSLRYRF